MPASVCMHGWRTLHASSHAHHSASLPPLLALPPRTPLPWALPSPPSRLILPSSTGATSHRPVSGCFLAVWLTPSACSRACDFSAHSGKGKDLALITE